MLPSSSLLSYRGEHLSLSVIGTIDAKLTINHTVVRTANSRRTTLTEKAGGSVFSRRGTKFWSLRLTTHIEHIWIFCPILLDAITGTIRRVVSRYLRWLPRVVSHTLWQLKAEYRCWPLNLGVHELGRAQFRGFRCAKMIALDTAPNVMLCRVGA